MLSMECVELDVDNQSTIIEIMAILNNPQNPYSNNL
jgi:hypothetical protein